MAKYWRKIACISKGKDIMVVNNDLSSPHVKQVTWQCLLQTQANGNFQNRVEIILNKIIFYLRRNNPININRSIPRKLLHLTIKICLCSIRGCNNPRHLFMVQKSDFSRTRPINRESTVLRKKTSLHHKHTTYYSRVCLNGQVIRVDLG